MVKKNSKKSMSYEEQREKENRRTVKIFSIILLIVMGASVIGFSIIGTPNVGSNSQNGQNVPYTQNIFQNPQTGQTYDGAIIDGTQFIFYEDIEEYKNDDELIAKRNQLLSQNSTINVYVGENFQNDNARFLIAQALRVNGISTNSVEQFECNNSQTTLIYTTNSSLIEQDISNCVLFESSSLEATRLSYALVYHLIKDLG